MNCFMNQRDLELLSAYLDQQITPSDAARLEARLEFDKELAATLGDLRAVRTVLRQLPKRRAPRNFTLTRNMVGLNPPLPRVYPIFRFATVVATLLFFFTFGMNMMTSRSMQLSAAAAPAPYAAQEAVVTDESMPAFAPGLTNPELSSLPDEANPVPTEEVVAAKLRETGDERSMTSLTSSTWQMAFALVAVLCGAVMAILRRIASNRWK